MFESLVETGNGVSKLITIYVVRRLTVTVSWSQVNVVENFETPFLQKVTRTYDLSYDLRSQTKEFGNPWSIVTINILFVIYWYAEKIPNLQKPASRDHPHTHL